MSTAADFDMLRERIHRAPFHRLLRFAVTGIEPGRAKIVMPFQDAVLANETYIHGGPIAALIDSTGDWAVATVYGRPVQTIDLRVDYLRSGKPGEDLVAEAEVVRLGREVSLADVKVLNPAGTAVAVGRATYRTPAGSAGDPR